MVILQGIDLAMISSSQFRPVLKCSTPVAERRFDSPHSCYKGSDKGDRKLISSTRFRPIFTCSTPVAEQRCDSPGPCPQSSDTLTKRRYSNRKCIQELEKRRAVLAWELDGLDAKIAELHAFEDAGASSSCSTQPPNSTILTSGTSNSTPLFTPGRPHTDSDGEHDGTGGTYQGDVDVDVRDLFGGEYDE